MGERGSIGSILDKIAGLIEEKRDIKDTLAQTFRQS